MRLRYVLVGLTVVLAACGSQAPSDTPPEETNSVPPHPSVAEASPTPIPGAPTAFEIEVGGLTIAGHCAGIRDSGAPVVLLMHGQGANQRQLAPIESHLAERTQVCAYDRPGGSGDSDPPAERPRPVADVAGEARELLAALELDPPYFLIGHSAGGTVAVHFAHAYPDEVAGFVISNPMPPYSAWLVFEEAAPDPPEGMEALREADYTGSNPEGIDFTGSDVMLDPLPDDLPFAVLFGEDRACGGFLDYCDAIYDPLQAMQASLAETGSGGRFIVVENSGHNIQEDDPEAYRAAVDEVWAEAID